MSDENDNFGIPQNEAPPAAAAKKAKALDPEEDKVNWPTIFIDFEDGKPNYEFLGVSGTMKDGRPFTHTLQVQRGVDVPVPPSVVNMLRDAKAMVGTQPDLTKPMVRTNRSSLPWHLVEKGKYIK